MKGQSQDEVRDRVERMLEERSAVYNKVPVRIDTTNLTPLSAAKKIHDVVSVRSRVQKVRDALGGVLDVT